MLLASMASREEVTGLVREDRNGHGSSVIAQTGRKHLRRTLACEQRRK